jgi:tRNA A37 threonylcarbamoyladenosine biosynthesis protein TsaE
MSIILGSLIFLYENTICLYHFDFYHYQLSQIENNNGQKDPAIKID